MLFRSMEAILVEMFVGAVKLLMSIPLNEYKEREVLRVSIGRIVNSSLYDPNNNVKYALIKQLEIGKCYPKLRYFRDRLMKDEEVLSEALNNLTNKERCEIVNSIREINTAMLLYIEGFNDENCENLVDVGNQNLRIMIDRYRYVISRIARNTIRRDLNEKDKILLEKLGLMIDLTSYSMSDIE